MVVISGHVVVAIYADVDVVVVGVVVVVLVVVVAVIVCHKLCRGREVFSSGSYSPVELALWVGSGDVDVTLGLSVSLVVALALAMDMCGSNVVRW